MKRKGTLRRPAASLGRPIELSLYNIVQEPVQEMGHMPHAPRVLEEAVSQPTTIPMENEPAAHFFPQRDFSHLKLQLKQDVHSSFLTFLKCLLSTREMKCATAGNGQHEYQL